jgi:hypothetical protein
MYTKTDTIKHNKTLILNIGVSVQRQLLLSLRYIQRGQQLTKNIFYQHATPTCISRYGNKHANKVLRNNPFKCRIFNYNNFLCNDPSQIGTITPLRNVKVKLP